MIILPLFFISEIILVVLYAMYGYYGDLFVNFVGWLGILSCIIIGRLVLNKENAITKYFRKSTFPIYLQKRQFYAKSVLNSCVC